MSSFLLTLEYHPHAKTWCALITGKSEERYGLERKFIGAMVAKSKTKAGQAEYLLDAEGLYEICEMGERYFVHVHQGQPTKLEKAEAIECIDRLEEAKREVAKKNEAEINAALNRVNFDNEGGYHVGPSDN